MSNNAKNLPEVKLGQYKGLAVTRHVRPLSEKTIDQEMVHQTRMRSVYHNSTAPAKRGSRVLLDFVGFMDGEEIPDSRPIRIKKNITRHLGGFLLYKIDNIHDWIYFYNPAFQY